MQRGSVTMALLVNGSTLVSSHVATAPLDAGLFRFMETTMISPAPAHPNHDAPPPELCLSCVRGQHGPGSPLYAHDPIASAFGLWATRGEAEIAATVAAIKANRKR